MNPDLQNYINHAKAAGKGDEVIKQELRGTGWQEPDINQAFGTGQAVIGASAAPASAGIFGIKFIVTAIVILLTLGVGAYFAFVWKHASQVPATTSNQNKNTTNNPPPAAQTSGTVPFHCKDIFSDADFTRIIGLPAAGYKFSEEVTNNNIYAGGLSCSYTKGAVIPANFSVGWYGGGADATTTIEGLISGAQDAAKSQGKTWQATAIVGVGSVAYDTPTGLMLVSSNKKYSLMLLSFSLGTIVGDHSGRRAQLNKFIEIAKAIDANLNKY